MPNRREIYSEAEVGKIMRRAVELQETSGNQEYTPGVTREELERIAGEMGISISALEKALIEVRKLEPEKRSWFTLKTEIERVIDGEIDPDDFDLVSAQMPKGNNQMLPAQVGRTLSARVQTGMATAQASVTSRNGRTKIKIESYPVLSLVFGGQAMLWAIISGAIGFATPGGNPMVGALLFSGLSALAGWLLVGGSNSARRSAEKLADRLTDAVEETLEDGKNSDIRARLESSTGSTSESTADMSFSTASESSKH